MPQVLTGFRNARLQRGYTLTDLAKKCGVTDGQMSRIERGESVPRPALRKALADLLDLDVADFDQEAS